MVAVVVMVFAAAASAREMLGRMARQGLERTNVIRGDECTPGDSLSTSGSNECPGSLNLT